MEIPEFIKERKLRALKKGQFYFFTNLQTVIEDLMQMCRSLGHVSICIQTLITQEEITIESLNKMIVNIDYLEARIQDNLHKLIEFMRHMIVMFDHVMFVLENNARDEIEAVQDMMNKVLEPDSFTLSQSTVDLVARRAKIVKKRRSMSFN